MWSTNICPSGARRAENGRASDARDDFRPLYLNFRSLTETLIVMLLWPFALAWRALADVVVGFNLSVAVVVGFIALAGVAARNRRGDADLSQSGAG